MKTVGLKIEIEGLGSITENVVKLENALKETKVQAKDLEKEIQGLNEEIANSDNAEEVEKLNKQLAISEKEYISLRNTIADTNEQLKGARKEQRDFIKQANTAKFKKGSYFDLNEQLKAARKAFKNLSEEERSGQIGKELTGRIQVLDKELKSLDKSIGQNQRNVGDYGKALERLGGRSFTRLSKFVTKANGQLNIFGKALLGGFVAFQAAKFIGRGVDQLDQFIDKINETTATVAEFSNATGESLEQLSIQTNALASTFDVDAQQIASSAKALSEQLGIGFDEALAKIEGRLVEGVDNNEAFLKSVEEFPATFEDASGAVTDLSKSNEKLLDTNKELADSQQEVAKSLKPTVDAIKRTGDQLKTGLLLFLAQLIKTFKPVIATAQQFGKAIAGLVGSLFGAGDATRGFQNILEFLANALNKSIERATLFINVLRSGIDFLRGDASTAFKLFTREGQILAKAEERLAQTTKDLTKEFQAETKELNSLFGQLANTNENTEERSKLIKQLNDQYGDYLPNIDLETAGQEELAAAYDATTRAIAQNLIDRKKIEIQTKAQSKVLEDNIELARAFENEKAAFKERERLDEELERLKSIEATSRTLGKTIAARVKVNKEFNKARSERIRLQKESNLNRKAATKEIELLDKASADLVNTLSDFISLTDAQATATEDAAANAAAAAKKAADEEQKLREKSTAAAIKDQQARQKKLAQARDKFIQEELAKEKQRAALLATLSAKLLDQRIKEIEDEGERRAAEIETNFERQRQAVEKGNQKLIDEQKKREAQLIKVFGEGSKEVLISRQQFQKDFVQIEKETTAIIINLKEEEGRELEALRAELRSKEIADAKKTADELRAFRDKALSDELNFITEEGQLRELKAQETLNRLLIQEEDAAARAEAIRIDAERRALEEILDIRNKLQALDDQEDFLQSEADAGVRIKQEEYDAILLARQQLNTELSELEKQQTENVRQNANAQLLAFNEAFGNIAGQFSQGLSAFDNVLDSIDSRQEERIAKSLERSQERQAQLETEAENATGLRKKFLQQQARNELSAQKNLEQQQEELAARAAKRDQRIAITESVIQGLLATTRAAAAPPGFPLNLPSVIAVGALSAANTAAIATKKFQDGGVIKGPSHAQGGVKFAVGGQVGFEAEGGEFIVNKKATAKNLPLLSRINSQKFAEGGFIGGVSPTPTITNINTVQADSVQALAASLSQVINNQEVILVTDDLDEDRENQERIRKRTILD